MQPSQPLFVDANVFMRYIVRDDERTFAETQALFQRVEAGELAIWTSHLVLAELVWTLRSYYQRPREFIADVLDGLLDLASLQIDRREMVRDAVDIYRNANVDFADAYSAADVIRRGESAVCSYDRDFDRLDVERLEPAEALSRGE